MSKLDLNLLNSLDLLLSEGNVTRAAERLNVTQPTMSGILERLRHHFNDPILVRVGRHMELTKQAESLIEPVREALLNIDGLMNLEVKFDPSTSSRSFSIMASDYCTLILLPRVISRISRIAPRISMEIKPLSSPINGLILGDLDLLIGPSDKRLLDDQRSETVFQSDYLFSDKFVCVVSKDHPLGENVTVAEYFRYPHIGVNINGHRSIEANTINLFNKKHLPNYTVSDFSLIPTLVSATNFTGIIQQRLAEKAKGSLNIKTFKPPFKIPDLHETMLWHPRNAVEPAHMWLRKVIMEEGRKLEIQKNV
jgi:DNA-binding transcriptional LysR family regulator